MKVSLYAAGVLLAGLIFTGCATSGGRVAAIRSASAWELQQRNWETDAEITLAKAKLSARLDAAVRSSHLAPDIATQTEAVMDARLAAYKRLQGQKDDLDTQFSHTFQQNAKSANTISYVKTGIGVSGVASGVAAAALVVASPANAVWVSVFAGYAGAVSGINNIFDNNGISREQIAGLETTVAQQYLTVSAGISLATLFDYASDETVSQTDWLTELQKDEANIQKLQGLALVLGIPVGPAQPTDTGTGTPPPAKQ